MSNALDDLYRDIILDHYRAPRGKKPVSRVDIDTDGHNPACGDELKLQVELANGTVKDVHVDCRGCAISVASASMLAEVIKGKSIEEAKKVAQIVKQMLTSDEATGDQDLGDLDALQGVRKFPVRIKCALLAWATFMEGLKNYENGGAVTDKAVTTEKPGDDAQPTSGDGGL